MIEDKGHSGLWHDLHVAKVRLTAFAALIEVNHDGEQAFLPVVAAKAPVSVWREAFTRVVAVEAESLVQADHLSTPKNTRHGTFDARPQQARSIGVINNHARVVTNVGPQHKASSRRYRSVRIAEPFRPTDVFVTLFA